jgi:hypothetical protein
MSNLPTYNSIPALTPHVPAVSMRDKIGHILDQSYGPFGEGIAKRMSVSILAALPDYDKQQARIEELELALKDVIGMLDYPNDGNHVNDMRGAAVRCYAALGWAT